MALLINNESPQNIVYNGNEVLKVVYNDVIVWEKQSEQQIYQRRIIVGDNLDNRTLYFDFPDDYVPVTTGTEGYAFISGDWSSIWEQPYGDDPMDTDILISGMGLLRTIYEPKKPSEKLTETQIGNEEIGEIYSIEDANASYRHCYIEDPNIRPIQVGDKIVAGTKFYGVVPDDYNANNINSIIYDANNNSVGYFSFYENTAELWIRASSSASFDYMFQKNPYFSVNNSQIISQTEYTVGSITNQSNPNFTYLLVDTTTLGNNEESVSIDTVTHYEGVADGLSLIISPCNTANYSNQSVLTAVENFNSSENYSLENVLNDLQVDIEQEIVTLQGTLIDVLNYEIIRNFEINITDGLDTYLDSANDGTILDYNGYFSMILGDLIDGIVEDYLLMIVNPNTMDVYFYEFNQESFNPLTGECVIEFNQFPNRDFLGPYFLLKKKE